jgi:hypothetical protein
MYSDKPRIRKILVSIQNFVINSNNVNKYQYHGNRSPVDGSKAKFQHVVYIKYTSASEQRPVSNAVNQMRRRNKH